MFNIKSFTIENLIINDSLLSTYINILWQEVFNKLDKKSPHHLMLMCKVEFTNKELGYRTLGHLRKVNPEDKKLFIKYLTERLGYLNDAYTSNPISKIVFAYVIKEGSATERNLLKDFSNKGITNHRFNNMNLPISMYPSDYGNIISSSIHESIQRFIVQFNNKIFQIDSTLDGLINYVTVLGGADLKWTDTKISEGFKREIGKSTIYFMDGEVVLRKQQLPAKPFRKINVDKKISSNFVTMDIETITKAGKLVPYLLCAYNGIDYITSYANTNLNQKQLFSVFINQLLSFFNKSNKLIVYAHNLSGYDGIFLLKHLFQFGKVEPLLFNGRLISIKVKLNIVGHTDKTIEFKDSFLLLPLSLRLLCTAFKVVIPKGFFPFKLTNIFYTGILPAFEYWTGIDTKNYENLLLEFNNKKWSFMNESIKYCKLDCKCLYEILTTFNTLIFKEFKINIHKVLTLPALAMRIFKSNFMIENSICQLLGNVETAIRESYTGGAVDVYKPHNRINDFNSRIANYKPLYYYDVNSLYPTVMASHSMPIGAPIFFEGNINKIESNAFGFFYCKITSPENFNYPILQRRIRTNEGLRTIAGLGTWEGWIFSEEMNNAIKFGYTFEITKGYLFEKGDLFSEYVTKMYELRKQYEKGHAMNLIAKLLLNSLYGKFGMKMEITRVDIYNMDNESDKESLKIMMEAYSETIQDYIQIDNTYLIVRDTMADIKFDESQDMYHGLDINIAIASAITSYARVVMTFFKNNPDYNLYYSDTDSVVLDKELPEEMIGNELGQLKLEHKIERAVFLAPKVYGLMDTDGTKTMKVKGIGHTLASELGILDLENLLFENSSKNFIQEKWYKKVIEGEITIQDIAYTLKVTSNKRSPIYINGIYSDTKPYNYNDL